jgi:carboxyl-terminal processing protease
MNFKIPVRWVVALLMITMLAPGVFRAQAQNDRLQERFSHALGITFSLPAGYELLPGEQAIYSNGASIIQIESYDSLLIHALNLEDACNILALDTPGYTAQVMNGGKRRVCVYSKGRQSYASVISQDHRYLLGGQEYDYLLIKAPKDDLLPVTESIAFVDDISAIHYLDEALRLIRVNFVYPDQVNWEQLYQQAMAMVNEDSSLDEAYRALDYVFEQMKPLSAHDGRLLAPDEENYSLFEIQDRLGYILTDDRVGQYRTVMLVYPQSSAEEAGLRVGDVVETINGKDARFVNEPQRRKVTLGVRRAGNSELAEISIRPAYYEHYLPVEGRRLANDIGYVETFSAGYNTSYEYLYQYPNDAHDTIRAVDGNGTCGWIVDVRRNHGGMALVMGLALGPLRGDGRWFGMKSVAGDIQWYDYANGAFATITDQLVVYNPYQLQQSDPPIAVLVSAETASMGEMTAFVLQNRPNAETRTFGEPTGGYLSDAFTVMTLFDGTQLALVNDRGIAPNRQLLPAAIQPDVEIRTDYTVYGTEDDPMIQAARQWLLEQPECG